AIYVDLLCHHHWMTENHTTAIATRACPTGSTRWWNARTECWFAGSSVAGMQIRAISSGMISGSATTPPGTENSVEVTLNDVIRMTDSGTFDRGRRYFNSGRVLSVTEDSGDGALLVFALVSGSGRTPYTLEITRSNYGLESLCSCPVGDNCKHGVAALLKLIQQQQRLKPAGRAAVQPIHNPLEAWLANLAESSAQPSALVC